MADKEATIILSVRDKASEALKKVTENSEQLRSQLVKLGAGMTAIGGATLYAAKSFIQAAGEMEQQRVSFETLTGSVELGRAKLKELTDFASKTPFEIPQILEQSKRLLAMGIAADDLIPTFKNLGNIASGVGMEKLPQLVLAFGQVKAATKLTGMELRQFTEAGVPLLQALIDKANESGGSMVKVGGASKEMKKLSSSIASAEFELNYFKETGGKTEKQLNGIQQKIDLNKAKLNALGPVGAAVFKRVKMNAQDMIEKISDGEVTFEQVQAALEGMDDEGGKFFQMMEKQSQTTAGQLSNFSDKIYMIRNAIGSALLPTVNKLLEVVAPLLARFSEFVTNNPKIATAFIAIGLAIGAIGSAMLLIVPIMFLFSAAMLPITLTIAAIVAVIGLVILAIIYWKDEILAFVEIAKGKFDEFLVALQPVYAYMLALKDFFVSVFKPLVVKAIEQIKIKFQEWRDYAIRMKDEMVKAYDSFSKWFENTFGKSIKEVLQDIKDNGFIIFIQAIMTTTKYIGKLAEKTGELLGKLAELRNFLSGSKEGGAVNAVLGSLLNNLGPVGQITNLLSRQHGGIIPGGAGDAVPALLHGGERVVSRTGADVNPQGSSGTTVNLIIEGDVNSMDMVDNIVRAVKDAIGRESELAQLGVSI